MLISQVKTGVSVLLGREATPRAVEFAGSTLGKWLFLALFSAIMIFFWQRSFINYTELPMPFVILAVAACTFLPQHRWRIMGFFTAFGIFLSPFWFHPVLPYTVAAQEGAADKINFSLLRYGITIFFFISAALFLLLIRRYRNTFLLRRPILAMLAVFFALVLLASQNVLHGIPQVILWSFIGVFGGYFGSVQLR